MSTFKRRKTAASPAALNESQALGSLSKDGATTEEAGDVSELTIPGPTNEGTLAQNEDRIERFKALQARAVSAVQIHVFLVLPS